MKKRIIFSVIALLSISLAGFGLTKEESPEPAPSTYNFYIQWDDSQCDCPDDQLISLGWQVDHWTNGGWTIVESVSGTLVDPDSPFYEVPGTATGIQPYDIYRIQAKAAYYQSGEICCYGKTFDYVLGIDLINDTNTVLNIIMQ